MTKVPRILSTLVCLILAVPVLMGAGRQQPVPQVPTFRTGTTLVEIDAVVKDKAGRFVSSLVAADFDLSEDGAPQRIDTFYVVEGRSVQRIPGAAPAADTIPGVSRSVAPQSVQRVFVLLFDQEHMATGGMNRAKQAAGGFLATVFQPGDLGGVVAGGKMIGNRLTSVREDLQAAVNGLKVSGETRSRELDMREWPRFVSLYEAYRVECGDDKVIGYIEARACADDPDRCHGERPGPLIVQKGRAITADVRASGQRTLDTLRQLATGFSTVPGRKTIILLTDGFFSEDLSGPMQAVLAQAARSSVRIYALDTRGLNRGSASSSIIDEPSQQRVFTAPDIPGPLPQFDIGVDGPNSLAVDSGGLMIRNENDLSKALREVAADASSYYVLGYRPTNAALDGKFRSIRVRVKRPGLVVRARKGYLALPPAVIDASAPQTPASETPAALAAAEQPARSAPPASGASVNAIPRPAAPASPSASRPGIALPAPVSVADAAALPAGSAAVRLRPSIESAATGADRLRETGPAAAAPADALTPDMTEKMRIGWEAYQRGDTKGAASALSGPASHPAAPPWVHYVLGWAAFAEGDVGMSRVQWVRVRDAVPGFEPVYLNLADCYLREQRPTDALHVLQQAEQRWPESSELLSAEGVVLTSIGRLDDALATFTRAVAVAPEDESSHFNLARASELRYVNAVMNTGVVQSLPAAADRERAVLEYRLVAVGTGSLADAARDGLWRMQPVDATRLVVSKPRTAFRVKDDAMGGTPARLTWSPDGQSFCIMAMRLDSGGTVTGGALRVVSMNGRVQNVEQPPDWAVAYWNWKMGDHAPWLPEAMLSRSDKTEIRGQSHWSPLTSGYSTPGLGREPIALPTVVYSFGGEEVGVARSRLMAAGSTFGWSPFAMGALAYFDKRGLLVVIDSNGRKQDVPDTRGGGLPAWSPDGRLIAYLERDRGYAVKLVDVSVR